MHWVARVIMKRLARSASSIQLGYSNQSKNWSLIYSVQNHMYMGNKLVELECIKRHVGIIRLVIILAQVVLAMLTKNPYSMH